MITPHKDWRQAKIPKSYVFTMLESETKSLWDPVQKESNLAVRDLDGQPLHFRAATKPSPYPCYFHSCCAVWKSTFMEQPDRRAEEFWERFQFRMVDLWGNREERQEILDIFKPPELVTPEDFEKLRKKSHNSITNVEPAVGQTEREEQAVDRKPEIST